MTDFFIRFFQALFSGLNPESIALTVRAFLAMLLGALATAAIDVLAQFLAWVSAASSGAEFAVDWWIVLRIMLVSALPVVIAYLKKSPSSDGVAKSN